ncbi:MAG: hypothetical protein WCC69_14240 [Pirellulales bacterium]
MFGRHSHRRLLKRPYRPESQLAVESLEGRVVLTASIGFDARQGVVSIMGSEAGDVATVSQQGKNVVVALTGVTSRTFKASQVKLVDFKGLGGDDSFTNNTAIRSRVDGGLGRDTLRGGSGADDIRGGGDNDRLFGNLGNDTLRGGAGNDDVYGDGGDDSLFGDDGDDHLDGRAGRDQLVGGAGLDREDDSDDRFSDGDDDGDGYDNDHDHSVNPGPVTPVMFDSNGFAQLTGTVVGEDTKSVYSFTATSSGTLNVSVLPDTNGRYAELELKNGTTGQELLQLESSQRSSRTSGTVAVVAGQTYVIEIESPSDRLAVGFTVNLQLS